MKLSERAKKLKEDIPAITLALSRADTPAPAKLFGWLCVGYALSPIDLIPDFIPLLGYLDDLLILPTLAYFAIRAIPADILSECRREASLNAARGAKRWYFAVPILLIWALVLVKLIGALTKK